MRQLIAELGLGDKIHFLGGIAVENLYAAADVFVHPTRWDACSLVTLEAMASALPVITTIMDGSSERITDGADGFVLPRPKGPSIAGAMPVGAERPGDAAARRRRRPQTSRKPPRARMIISGPPRRSWLKFDHVATMLSVLMPVRNGARFLAASIDSILRQTYSRFRISDRR